MGLLDNAKDLIGEHSEEINKGVDKAAELANQKTGGQYEEQIEQGAEVLKDQIGDLMKAEGSDPATP